MKSNSGIILNGTTVLSHLKSPRTPQKYGVIFKELLSSSKQAVIKLLWHTFMTKIFEEQAIFLFIPPCTEQKLSV